MTADCFIDTLRDAPDDVTRLVFADWLDDHGDGLRAEHIRRAVHVERLPPDHPDRSSLTTILEGERQTHTSTWLGARPECLVKWACRGGLVDELTFNSTATLADIEPLLRRHPVRLLSLTNCPALQQLATSPVLSLVRGLGVAFANHPFQQNKQRALLDPLFASPYLTRLDDLTIINAIDNHLARALTQCPGLVHLRSLQLASPWLDDAGVVALLRPRVFPHLHTWHVDCPQATGLSLANLTRPDRALLWRALSWSPLRGSEVVDFVSLRRCQNLRWLSLNVPPLRMPGEEILAWLDDLSELTSLNLVGRFDLPAIEYLVGRARLPRLRTLSVSLHYLYEPNRQLARDRLARSRYAEPPGCLNVIG